MQNSELLIPYNYVAYAEQTFDKHEVPDFLGSKVKYQLYMFRVESHAKTRTLAWRGKLKPFATL